MKLLARKRESSALAPVSVDALVAVIGGTADELVARFGQVGEDFMSRPTISFEHAKQAHGEWLVAVDRDYTIRLEYGVYQEDRLRGRQEAYSAACAAARAASTSPNRGGQESQIYLQEQWTAGRAALVVFDAENPELTISEFRRRRTT
jgi:hypothetical protein